MSERRTRAWALQHRTEGWLLGRFATGNTLTTPAGRPVDGMGTATWATRVTAREWLREAVRRSGERERLDGFRYYLDLHVVPIDIIVRVRLSEGQ